ncbi:MAG: alcohol dehydrogenase catalytic domain-containing protein [Spirochaetia bacterium]
MKAARLFGKQDIRYVEVARPHAGPGEIILRTKAASVCGTDVRFFSNGRPGVDEGHPITLGHELSGIVDEVDSDAAGYESGMRVAVAPNFGCGLCDFCVSGQSHLCNMTEAIGVTIDGAFAEFVRIPVAAVRQGNVVEIPEQLSFEEAALAEPLSCVYNAYERIGIHPGEVVLIIGSGPIGIMHAKVALMAGAAKVFLNDVNAARLEQAKSIEPRLEVLQSSGLTEEIARRTDGRMCDLVITAAGVAAAQQMSFGLAGVNGRIMFFGGLPKGESVVELDTNEIHYKQLTVSGTTRQSLRQYRKCMQLMSDGILDIGAVITARRPMSELKNILRSVGNDDNLKTAVLP